MNPSSRSRSRNRASSPVAYSNSPRPATKAVSSSNGKRIFLCGRSAGRVGVAGTIWPNPPAESNRRARLLVTQFEEQNGQRECERDDVGEHDGPRADKNAVGQPQYQPDIEQHEHDQGNVAGRARAPRLYHLRDKCRRGQRAGDKAEQVGRGYGGFSGVIRFSVSTRRTASAGAPATDSHDRPP